MSALQTLYRVLGQHKSSFILKNRQFISNKTLLNSLYKATNTRNDYLKLKYLTSSTHKLLYSSTASTVKQTAEPEKKPDITPTPPQTPIEQKQQKLKEEKKEQEMKLLTASNPSFVDSLPLSIQPYLKLMRIDRPIGTLVVLWPGVWSILGTASYLNQTMPDWQMLAIFTAGAFAMRSAGCIVNDLWDRNYDKKVERTKNRPLANGQVGTLGAVTLLGANLSLSLYLLLQLNLTTQILGACGLFPTIFYPAAKRFSNWPQLYLGFAINWGALMGWSALLCNNLDHVSNIFSFLPALSLYASCISWTIFYDTIYAHQDKDDDKKLGLKSTTFTFGKRQKLWLFAFSTFATSNLCLFGYLTGQQPIYYGFMGLVYAHFLKQLLFVNLNSVESCNRTFKSNNTIGVLTSLGLLCSLFAR